MAGIRMFCDKDAATPALRLLEQEGRVDILTAADAAESAAPARPRMQDLFLRTGALAPDPSGDAPSPRYEAILAVLGFEHRREAGLLDTAQTLGCAAFVTTDSDILRKREGLEALLALRLFHPFRDEAALVALAARGA